MRETRIAKISFTGNKIYKDKKLRSPIPVKSIKSGNLKIVSPKSNHNSTWNITIDKKLLNNFYLNNGYYDVKVNTSFAKLISNNEFELIFNIDAEKNFFFNKFNLNISNDYSKNNFKKIYKLF